MTRFRFFEWNYNTRVASEWARSGECNGCGACCMARISYQLTKVKGPKHISPDHPHNAGPMGGSTDEVGIWYEARLGKRRRFISKVEVTNREGQHRCPSLQEDKKCAIHALKEFAKDRMLLCDSWPLHPSQVELFEECSYTFVKVSEWAF